MTVLLICNATFDENYFITQNALTILPSFLLKHFLLSSWDQWKPSKNTINKSQEIFIGYTSMYYIPQGLIGKGWQIIIFDNWLLSYEVLDLLYYFVNNVLELALQNVTISSIKFFKC